MTKDVLKYLQPNAVIPIDMETTTALVNALKERLAQPEQEPVVWADYESKGIHHKPVAWMDADGNVSDNNDHKCFPIPLYTRPPQRTWVGLTDEEIAEVEDEYIVDYRIPAGSAWNFAQAIEAKLKQKNGYAEEKNT